MRRMLYYVVFFSGFASLAVEFAASRLLGNFFGTSNLVWASIIGLILIYLTAGYFLGGTWSDRSPKIRTMLTILVWAAFFIGLIPIVSRPILRFASQAFEQLKFGVLAGSFVAVMILFSIPVTLLGTASPFAIRLAIQDTHESGKISGRIYAISTLGSFLGTFLPVLVLIPQIGTYRTFLAISGLLLIVVLTCMWKSVDHKSALVYFWMPIVILLLYWLGVNGTDKNSQGLIFEVDSSYNYIQVQEIDGYRYLRLNEGQGIHSIWHPTEMFFAGPWEEVLAGPFFNPAPYQPSQLKNMAIIGLAAGTTARQASIAFPGIRMDGYEIDPEIIEIGKEYFGMDIENLNSIPEDGRIGLHKSTTEYQLISVDAYRPPYIPPHLTTREFFREIHDHLTGDGVMVINVGRAPGDRRLVNALFNTIAAEFPSVYIMDLPYSFNTLIYATKSETRVSNLAENYDILLHTQDTPLILLQSLQVAVNNLQPLPDQDQELVFTDDLAPVELITNSMIIKFLFSNQMEQLQ